MENINVLISTMNQNNLDFLKKMNIDSNAIVVNQIENNTLDFSFKNSNGIRIINDYSIGLSKSRNKALMNSESKICVLADDDVNFADDYEEKVLKAHAEYPEADIISFIVERVGDENRSKTFSNRLQQINFINALKISSVEISFKRDRIMKAGLKFNENIGAGTKYLRGEDNVFIYDALKKDLKVLFVPLKIAEVDVSNSTWFTGFNKGYFISLGATYFCMSNSLYPLLIIQFAIRKYPLYKKKFGITKAIKYMLYGVRQYKNENLR